MTLISISRQITFSFTGILLFFISLEGIACVAKPLYIAEERDPAVFQNRYDNRKKVEIATLDTDDVAPSVSVNITDNFLTSPDDDLIFHVTRNPEHKVIYGYTKINADGYRGEDFTAATFKNDAHKVMIIGDSCAFGWGLPDYTETWQAQLKEKLAAEKKPYRVINFGQPGYSSHQGRLIFERWFDKVKPDTLVIYFGWNDIWSTPLLTDKQTIFMMKLSNLPAVKWFFSTNTYELLRAGIQAIAPQTGRKAKETYTGEGKIRAPMNETLQNFGAFVDKATRAGTKVIVIGPPFENRQFHRAFLMPDYIATLYDAYSARASFVELRPMRHYNLQARDYYLEDGFHPNKKGSELIATELSKIIVGQATGATDKSFLRKEEVIIASKMPKLVGAEVDDATTLSGSGQARKATKGVTETLALIYGPYHSYKLGGKYRARFRMKAGRIGEGIIATIDVAADIGKKRLISRRLTAADFPQEGEWYDFELPFTLPEGGMKHLETRVLYGGGADLSVDMVTLLQPLGRTVPGTPPAL